MSNGDYDDSRVGGTSVFLWLFSHSLRGFNFVGVEGSSSVTFVL